MILTNRKQYNIDGATIIIYEYFNSLYSSHLYMHSNNHIYISPLYTLETEAFVSAVSQMSEVMCVL